MFKITNDIDQNKIIASIFKRSVKIAGLTMPDFDPATVNTPDFTPATTVEVADAAYKAATAGKDPSTDKEVQRLLMSKMLGDQIGGMYYRNQVALSKAELEHYQEHAPALLEELVTAFDEAVDSMEEAIPVIGHIDLQAELAQMGHLPDSKAQALTSAYTANTRATRLIEAMPAIAEAVNGASLNAGGAYSTVTFLKPSGSQFLEHRLDGRGTQNMQGHAHNVWDALNVGVTTELATTPAEVQARIKRIQTDQDNLNRDFRAEESQHSEARSQAKAMGFN